jgi:hypothetical protein
MILFVIAVKGLRALTDPNNCAVLRWLGKFWGRVYWRFHTPRHGSSVASPRRVLW